MNLVNNIGNAHYRLIAYQPPVPAIRSGTGSSPARGVTQSTGGQDARGAQARSTPAVEITDTLELSEAGTAAYLLDRANGTKLDRLLAVRTAIQNGTFETPERLEGTVDRLLDLLA